jgi:hypothetical protein
MGRVLPHVGMVSSRHKARASFGDGISRKRAAKSPPLVRRAGFSSSAH